jgi:Zn-dependent hydrolases, including glyoxylases
VLHKHGLTFQDIKLIVVTHAHTDHAGSAARIRELSGAPILAHQDDTDYYSRKLPMTYCTTSWVGRLFVKTPVPHEPYVGFAPDILMNDAETISLKDFGVDGIVRHTAGHTPGSIGIELASQDALVGDLIASGILIGGIAFNGRAIRPPFEDDPQTWPASSSGSSTAVPSASTWVMAAAGGSRGASPRKGAGQVAPGSLCMRPARTGAAVKEQHPKVWPQTGSLPRRV